jgi:AcrR family transcriptional regulator
MAGAFSAMTRNQRPRGATTRCEVVNAALAIADRDGLDGLRIRSIAKLVGAPPMSIYTHFSNKEELLDLMYEEVSRRMYVDEGNPTWQAELVALCHRVRSILKDHPKWAPLLARPASPLAVPLRERVLTLMTADRMPEADAFKSLSSAALVGVGLTLMELTLKGPQGESAVQQRFERLKEWVETPPGQDHPVTRSAISKLGPRVLDDTFSYAVRALITGLEASRDPPLGRGGEAT